MARFIQIFVVNMVYFLVSFFQIIQTPGLWETDNKGMSLTSGGGGSGQGACGGYCVI